MMNGTCMLEAVLYMQDDMVEEVPIDDDQPSQRAGDAERDVSYKTVSEALLDTSVCVPGHPISRCELLCTPSASEHKVLCAESACTQCTSSEQRPGAS